MVGSLANINEKKSGNDRGLFKELFRDFSGRTERIHDDSQQGWSVSR